MQTVTAKVDVKLVVRNDNKGEGGDGVGNGRYHLPFITLWRNNCFLGTVTNTITDAKGEVRRVPKYHTGGIDFVG